MKLGRSLRNFLRRHGYELSRTPGAVDFLHSRQVDLVLDVGANSGQYAQSLRDHGYNGRVHSFEPIKAVYEDLARAAAKDALWSASNCAVGAAEGSAEINVSDFTVFSSIRASTTLSTAFDSKSAVVRKETVKVITLDSVDTSTAGAVFLKIDTQGYEREVLTGAKATLARCVGLQLELPVEHLYEDVWSFNEALQYVDALGFVPAQFRMVNPLHDDKAAGIEFDCIFRRKR
jgi:FkbM family methyltransferase